MRNTCLAPSEQLLQDAVPRNANYSRTVVTLFSMLSGLGLVVILALVACTIGRRAQHLAFQEPSINLAWPYTQLTRGQRLPQQARESWQSLTVGRVWQPRPPIRVWQSKPAVAAVPEKGVSEAATGTSQTIPRRSALGMLGGGVAGFSQHSWFMPLANANEVTKEKVVVVGGDGFIGSRVCQQLLKIKPEAQVVAISRTHSTPPAWAASETWTRKVEWVAADALVADYAPLLDGATTVISCLGSFGSQDDEKSNGEANVRLADAAVKANAKRFVYISVHPLVSQAAGAAGLLPEYFKGKLKAEAAVQADFGTASSTIVRPTLVYGGDVFNVNPPRVPGYWGGFVETVLSTAPVRLLADLSGSIPALKVALLPPVDVDTCARAVALAALGAGDGGDVIGTDAIKALSYSAKAG